MTKVTKVSILCATNRPEWKEWLVYQINKLTLYKEHERDFDFEILINDMESPTTGSKRNALCAKCTGKYIVMLDDDDYQAPDRIYRQIEYLEKFKKGLTFPDPIINYNLESKKTFLGYGPSEGSFCFTKEFYEQSNKFNEYRNIPGKPTEGAQFIRGQYRHAYVSNDRMLNVLINHGKNCVNRKPTSSKHLLSPLNIFDKQEQIILKSINKSNV